VGFLAFIVYLVFNGTNGTNGTWHTQTYTVKTRFGNRGYFREGDSHTLTSHTNNRSIILPFPEVASRKAINSSSPTHHTNKYRSNPATSRRSAT